MKRSLSRLQPLRRVAALVLASLLAACSLTPDHVRPAPPVAPAWVDAGSARSGMGSQAELVRELELRLAPN